MKNKKDKKAIEGVDERICCLSRAAQKLHGIAGLLLVEESDGQITLNSKSAGGICFILMDIADEIESDSCAIGDLIEKIVKGELP